MTEPEIAEKDAPILKELAKITTPVQMTDQDFRFRGLLYGDFGAGKTTLGIQIAALLGQKICLVYADSAWTVILNYHDIYPRVHKLPFGGLSTIDTILKARDYGLTPWCEFDVLMWDTASTSANTVLRNLVGARKFPKDQYAPDLEGRPHYRLLELGFRELIPKLRESDLHIIYTAHLRTPSEDDVKKGKLQWRPAFPEATYKEIAREANLIGYMHKKEESGNQRWIQLNGTDQTAAKCQIPGIPERTYKSEEIPQLISRWLESNK